MKSVRRPRADPAAVRLLVCDVDGVMTDGQLYYGPRGETLKAFNVRDGLGLRALAEAGVDIAVISGRNSAAVARRCRELAIAHVMQGQQEKLPALEKLLARLNITAAQCACVGDDIVDIPLFETVGIAFCVADAHPTARKAAHFLTALRGGRGAVREVCDYLLTGRARAKRRRA